MMNIWLVYEGANVARNQFFINQWQLASHKYAVKIETVLLEDLVFGIRDGQPSVHHLNQLPLPDAVVMRLNNPLLSHQFELMGIPVFNNARVSEICNDKRRTHQLVSPFANAIDTVFLRGDEAASPLPYPVVIKGANSCGGRAVYKAVNDQEFVRAMKQLQGQDALVQAMSDTPGRDVRAYVLGKEIIAVMMRVSDTDFRSNLGQGGDAVPYQLTQKDEQTVKNIIQLFDFGLVGIDFIMHKGQLLFNEIEDAVGTRMLFANGHEDIVDRYLRFILNKLEKN